MSGAFTGAPANWTRAKLIHPSDSCFVYLGATSGRWRLPLALPRARRRTILARMHAAATALNGNPHVLRADVFQGVLRPPGQPASGSQDVASADFDAALLIETTTVATATALADDSVLTELHAALAQCATRCLMFTGCNPRRIGQVDHEKQGVFLFNYFSARSLETNLYAWQYTAGWFQDETGLDNSTVLQPTPRSCSNYTLVNHCRWDHLWNVLPALLLKRSFRDFVLRVFSEHDVIARPILYRLYRPGRRS